MRNLSENDSVVFTREQNAFINEQIEVFVEAMNVKNQSTSYYAAKRNTTADKAAKDTFLGKKAEYATMFYLWQNHGFPLIPVDIEIRSGPKKGWGEDLPYRQHDQSLPNVHVKACNAWTYSFCKDYSWTFQYENNDGRHGRDKIFDSPGDDLVSLVFLEHAWSNKAEIKAVLPWAELKAHLKEPKKEELKKIKKSVYFKDLNSRKSILDIRSELE